jgi:hypothetical protein
MVGPLAFHQRDRARERRAVSGAQASGKGRDIGGRGGGHCGNQAGKIVSIKVSCECGLART